MPPLKPLLEQVDFDWGTHAVSSWCGDTLDDQILCGMGEDHVSVVWTGFFRAELSEAYTFWIESDDGVRFYLQGMLPKPEHNLQASARLQSIRVCQW